MITRKITESQMVIAGCNWIVIMDIDHIKTNTCCRTRWVKIKLLLTDKNPINWGFYN